MGLTRILVLTFKPAVESAWRDDLMSHVDFEGWQYVSNKDAKDNNINIDQEFELADKSRPIVVFGSFQDLLGTNDNGGIKTKMSLYMLPIGILLSLMNIILEHGEKERKICSRRKMKKMM